MGQGKNSSRPGKFRECYFEPGKLKYFNTADLVPLKAGRNIGVNVITTIFLPSEEGKFMENLSVLLNDLKERLHIVTPRQKLPLALTFCIYLVKIIVFLPRKSQVNVREKSGKFDKCCLVLSNMSLIHSIKVIIAYLY